MSSPPLRLCVLHFGIWLSAGGFPRCIMGASLVVRLTEKGNSIPRDAIPVYLIITMINWIRTSTLSTMKSH